MKHRIRFDYHQCFLDFQKHLFPNKPNFNMCFSIMFIKKVDKLLQYNCVQKLLEC